MASRISRRGRAASLTANALRRAALATAATLGVLVTMHSTPAAQAPSVEELVSAAESYLTSYARKVSGVTLDEALMLTEMTTRSLSSIPQRLSSDLILLNVGGEILGMRDVYTVDTRALRPKETRIAQVLAEPTAITWQAAQQYSREHAVYLRANVVLWFSDPALALRCLKAQHRARLTFKLEGSKRMNGAQVYGLGFKETGKDLSFSILQMPGDPLASGRFWVEPGTGRIHQTEFWPQSDTHTARVQVQYAPDEKLGVLLPRSASHTFEAREPGFGISGTGGGGNAARLSFESTATYSNPRYKPIDLRAGWVARGSNEIDGHVRRHRHALGAGMPRRRTARADAVARHTQAAGGAVPGDVRASRVRRLHRGGLRPHGSRGQSLDSDASHHIGSHPRRSARTAGGTAGHIRPGRQSDARERPAHHYPADIGHDGQLEPRAGPRARFRHDVPGPAGCAPERPDAGAPLCPHRQTAVVHLETRRAEAHRQRADRWTVVQGTDGRGHHLSAEDRGQRVCVRTHLDGSATGAIHQTELWSQSKSEISRTTIVYARDASLELLLPREATHAFQLFDCTRINSLAALDSSTKYTFDAMANPRTPARQRST